MQTILEATQPILAESGLPIKYWADAIQTVVYVKNFLPSSRQPNKIPVDIPLGISSILNPLSSRVLALIVCL